jgi:hypothetical protein
VRKRLLFIFFSALVAAVVVILTTPFAVAHGLRLWLQWKARQEKLAVRIDKIDAPLFHPVVLRGIHVTSEPANPISVAVDANETTVSLDLKAIALRRSERVVRSMTIDTLHADVRRANRGKLLSHSGWGVLRKILPGNFSVAHCDLRLESGPSLILVRGVSLSASEIETGKFAASEITVMSPWFRQSFSQLRGATSWQGDRLTLAGLSLARGLDLQWIWIDLSQLAQQTINFDFDLDAFGGKIRAEVSDDWGKDGPTWNLAGSATDISLAQTSEAIGFTDHIDGALHAAKFIFRGNPRDPTRATASLWTELTQLSWRNRAAEVIMLGASLYNRNIDLQQVYVKQRKNQFTLNGQAALPEKSTDWLSPGFRGNISAQIADLGDFAALFGANPIDFAGAIAAEGTVDTRDRKIGGHVTCSGTGLTIFKTGIDNFFAGLKLNGDHLEIEELDLSRNKDTLRAIGTIDISRAHNYSGEIHATLADLADYLSSVDGPLEHGTVPTGAEIEAKINSAKWKARGTLHFPQSSPVNLTADFSFPIGTTWDRFATSSLTATIEFPSLFLGKAPQLFHPSVFRDGILSGELALSNSLKYPRIDGDAQLMNGKVENASLNLTEASGRIKFAGDHASIEFLNASTKDADLSMRGEIDFGDINALAIKINSATPLFDLTARSFDCANKIGIEPVRATLAPAIGELELCGALFGSTWTIAFKQETAAGSSPGLSLNDTARNFVLCLGNGVDEKTLSFGVPPRPEPTLPKVGPKKRKSRS